MGLRDLLAAAGVTFIFASLLSCGNADAGIGTTTTFASPTPPAVVVNEIKKGQWGGNEIEMKVTDSGATLEFICATGEITEPIQTNTAGQFNAHGTVYDFTGPIPIDGFKTVHGDYSGVVNGDLMQLEIEYNFRGQNRIEKFTLEHGKERIGVTACPE